MIKKEDLKRIDELIWEIPRSFREDMKVAARFFASEKILPEIFKDKSLWQLINLTTLPGIYKYALAMPDIHEGYGSPIGGVACFDLKEGIISPGICGYDINCGVRLLLSPFSYDEIKNKIQKITEQIYKEVPSGVGQGGWWDLNENEMENILYWGAQYLLKIGYALEDDIENTESKGCLEGANPDKVSDHAKKRGKDQIGTIGAGNHFVEIQKVQEIYSHEEAKVLGLEKNRVTIMIHCGSRGLGHQVATDYIRKAIKYLKENKINLVDIELAYFPFESKEGNDYLEAMKASANFAWANREFIAYEIRKAFNKVFGTKPEEIKQVYDVAHNIVKIEEYDGKKLVIHRKGATRAFWKGHDELPEKYKNIGQPTLIPGSMGTASYVLIGQIKAKEISFGTAPHGAGRVMSRNEARRKIEGRELKKRLEEKGIAVAEGSLSGLAEEAPEAYKDVNEVVEIVHQIGIAKKVAKLVPLGVIKG